MTTPAKALIWAGAIIAAAIAARGSGLEDGASFGIIAGLSGAAWGSLFASRGCGRSC
ncbi:hypothetical protein [Qipengyuania nanhaisediminis]|uniref:hypothetical protein n=1 Tax=Qipengyuania nanhaisediminis TaxID=604088 RepID=UPI0038B23A1A